MNRRLRSFLGAVAWLTAVNLVILYLPVVMMVGVAILFCGGVAGLLSPRVSKFLTGSNPDD